MQQHEEMQPADTASQEGLTDAPKQPSREDELLARLAQVEGELEKAMDVVRSVENAAETLSFTPAGHLTVAKQQLTEADELKPSQHKKDAIQNINYALAALKREV